MSAPGDGILRLEAGSPGFPPGLAERLRSDAPAALYARGDPSLLRLPLVALFCSERVPPALVLPGYDLARALRDAAVPVVGGFQSAMERECLLYLLRGEQPVVVSPARSIGAMRLPPAWGEAVRAGRMLIVSGFAGPRRPTRALATRRNRMVAALADRVLILHASPGGGLQGLAREALARGARVECLAHPENRDLLLLGVHPVMAGQPHPAPGRTGTLTGPPARS